MSGKRFYAALISMIMAITMLATCALAESTPKMLGNIYLEGKKVAEEKITLKMYTRKDARQLAFNDMEFFKRLEEQTNVHIEWEADETGDRQVKSLIIASGEYPDAFFSGVDSNDVSRYYGEVFMPLNELIEQYAPNMMAFFEENPEVRKACTYIDGNIYSLGQTAIDASGHNSDQLFIYKPWLDKLGLAIPTTMEEFKQVLIAFRDQDPNGNGKQDEIPFSFRNSSGIQGIHSLFAAFGYSDFLSNEKAPGPVDHFVQEGNKAVFVPVTEQYKNAIIFLHGMFAEKLFDQEGFTQDVQQYFAKGKTEEVTLGSFMLWNSQNLAGPERGVDYVAVAPMAGPDGTRLWTKNILEYSGFPSSFAIPVDCKDPVAVIRWIDQFYDKTTAAESWQGCIGVALEMQENGVLGYMPLPEGVNHDERRYKDAPLWGPTGLSAKDIGVVLEMPSSGVSKATIKAELYDPYLNSVTLPTMFYTADESAFTSTTGLDIQNYVNTQRTKWLLQGGIEAEWDAYLAQLAKLQLEEYTGIIQGAFDRYNGI